MHKRTRACSISTKTKKRVYERDQKCCIFCGAPGLPEAHYIPRSHGGLGIEQNIITACRPCHDKLDNSVHRQQMLKVAAEHLKQFYPEWDESKLIYDKWHKDKGLESMKSHKTSKDGSINADFAEKPQKDNEYEPPKGFFFI